MLVPPMDEAKFARRRAQLPGVEVQPLRLSARELGLDGMRLLMGAGGRTSAGATPLYMMKIANTHGALRDPRQTLLIIRNAQPEPRRRRSGPETWPLKPRSSVLNSNQFEIRSS